MKKKRRQKAVFPPLAWLADFFFPFSLQGACSVHRLVGGHVLSKARGKSAEGFNWMKLG